MQRWVLENAGLVRGYLLTESEPSDDQKRRLAFGAEGDGDLAEAGTWRLVPAEAGLVGDDWTWNGTAYAPPVRV